MTPKSKIPANEIMIDAINDIFGSIDAFKEKFSESALGRFGSGWAWLTASKTGLEIFSTANQDSPLMQDKTPIIGIDVWEHAYYLKYQNKRTDYINAWWNVINWEEAETLLSSTSK
jgi:Fe-Mn family superoxide dismutase